MGQRAPRPTRLARAASPLISSSNLLEATNSDIDPVAPERSSLTLNGLWSSSPPNKKHDIGRHKRAGADTHEMAATGRWPPSGGKKYYDRRCLPVSSAGFPIAHNWHRGLFRWRSDHAAPEVFARF